MPRYHFSETESRDVVAFLEEEFRDFDAPKEILDPPRVNQTQAENGRKLFRAFGCFSRHDPTGPGSEKLGPVGPWQEKQPKARNSFLPFSACVWFTRGGSRIS